MCQFYFEISLTNSGDKIDLGLVLDKNESNSLAKVFSISDDSTTYINTNDHNICRILLTSLKEYAQTRRFFKVEDFLRDCLFSLKNCKTSGLIYSLKLI
jgi:hypothetical protein